MNNTVKAILFGLSFVFLLQTSFIAAAPVQKEPDSLMTQVLIRKELVVGVAVSEPWVMKNSKGGWFGYDIDVSKKLASDLGVSVRYNALPWDHMISALLEGSVDIIISGMTISTARNLKVNFTIPYSNSGIRVLANKKQVGHFTDIEAFDRHKIILAVRTGSEAVSVARTSFPKAQIQLFDEENEMIDAVRSGEVTALVAASPLPEFQEARYPNELAMPVLDRLQRTSEAFAIRKQDGDSLNVLNNWILQNLENGWLQDRHDYWFTSIQWRE